MTQNNNKSSSSTSPPISSTVAAAAAMGVVINNNDNNTMTTTTTTTTNNNNNNNNNNSSPTIIATTAASTSMATTNVRRVRRYRIFPGRNRFFCDGRIIMAKQISVFYFTVTLLVGTCVSFFIFDSPYLSNKISPLVPIVAACLFLFVLFSLFRTSFTDPGILPRATPAEAADVEQQIVPNQSNSSTMRPPPRTKEVMINNQTIKLKYCFTCKIFRPPRASHCSLCDNCVERFDHHCPWVGNCVGKRNYRFFYMFIVSLAFLCIYVFSCIITHFILLSKTMTFVEAVKQSPVSVVEMIICFFSVWSILGLAGFHTYLIMSNLTTNEDIKGSFSKRNHVSVTNPYSLGSIFRNCYSILCSPIGPSLIHRRSYVYCEESIITTTASNNNSNHQTQSPQSSKQSQSIRFPGPVAYPLQPTAAFISGQQQQQQQLQAPGMASYYHHHQQQQQQQQPPSMNKSPQIISHQLKQQSNGQSQYYVPMMKNMSISQQLHSDLHGQVYLGHDIDELDKQQQQQQQRYGLQPNYYHQQQQPQPINDNSHNSIVMMAEPYQIDHHNHHHETANAIDSLNYPHSTCQQACYYQKQSSSSPSIRQQTNIAQLQQQSDYHNYTTTMVIDPYYPNLLKKNNSSSIIINDNDDNDDHDHNNHDYCNYPSTQTQSQQWNNNNNNNNNNNSQISKSTTATSCSHHHHHHHHHHQHHPSNSSKSSTGSSVGGGGSITGTYQSRSNNHQQKRSQGTTTTVKGGNVVGQTINTRSQQIKSQSNSNDNGK
ncbi:Palmitoyltransferase zdhhc14, variant 2 [Dermatophagoides farinae]|uniref:Palmitoyltransferase n=1 Tax=Dermatophagoides farinae TaxID=6954 RepID=A0A922HYS7_DERFA|nr:Palmitoyltransferase zdhhc14, variant 2 [Dermatophagoides farinae]